MTDLKKLYINGNWTESTTKETYSIKNPADGTLVSTLSYGGQKEASNAIEAAHQSFSDWADRTADERAKYLYDLYTLVLRDKETLAELITLEMGKPLKEARGEVQLAANYLLWNAEEGKRIYGEIIPASSVSKRLHITKSPVGPVGAITPWNFPMSMLTRKISPALAAGCTIVLKPASQVAGTAHHFFKLIDEANFPQGVANLVVGKSREIGEEFVSNNKLRKIAFTGSTDVGKQLTKQSADQMKRISMELGGHAPFIVFEDADLEAAAEGAIVSKYRNAGQTCICLNRLFVQSSIKDQFEKILCEKVEKLNVGNGMDDSTDIGPLVDKEALEKVESHVEDATHKGAVLLTGGKVGSNNGYYYRPAILSNVSNDMDIMTEETFGPVAPIFEFNTEEEVITEANNTNFGLAAYYYTKDLSRSMRVHEKLDYGIIGVNDAVPTTVQAPFGGLKESGVGKEGGHQGIEEYVETKFISYQI